ncbi:MAG: alcohol dehydrogenase catalytic domain-containing protein [Verrucomicrobiales bacterium]|nr:alcohol dehydrogenase catalytic domain-containing protein [Verrucomicrobiales bacterium]
MRAVCLQSNTPKDLALIDAPRPEPGPEEIRLRVEAVGICGSDVSAALGKPNFDFVKRPRILGHEFSATIDVCGGEVTGWKAGQKVCAIAIHSCHKCDNCRAGNTQICEQRQILGFHMSGAMADYVCVHQRYVMPLRYDLGFVEGALVEPLAVASRCVLKMCDIQPGQDVIVSGCGIIGLLCALLARAAGGNVTVTGAEWDEAVRLKKARDLGLQTRIVSDENPLAKQLPELADRLIEASGAPQALAAASDSVKWGGLIGIIATYGSNIDWPATNVVRREQKIHPCMAAAWDDFEMAMKHLRDGVVPVDELVETFPLDDALGAFEASFEKTTPKALMMA